MKTTCAAAVTSTPCIVGSICTHGWRTQYESKQLSVCQRWIVVRWIAVARRASRSSLSSE